MISLLVPTMNRSDFVIRLLRYYHALGFQGHIFIGDSSNDEHASRTKKAITACRDKLNIVHREYPGLNNAQCTQRLLDQVSTPYAAFLPDDDFLVPRGLERCMQFLDSHPEYVAAHGLGTLFELDADGVYGRPKSASYYRQAEFDMNRASERLEAHLNRGSVTLFSVHRVEAMRLMYRDIENVADQSLATEVLPCCISVVLGKIKQLDCLYLIRQAHDQRYRHFDIFDRLVSPSWSPSYQVMCNAVAEQLARIDGISHDDARNTFKKAFWRSLILTLGKHHPSSGRSRRAFHAFLRAIPGARILRKVYRAMNRGVTYDMSLDRLLSASSKYHDDFLVIHKILTEARDGSTA